MRKLLVIASIFGIVSCQKEDPQPSNPPTSNPTLSATQESFLVVNGDGHLNDTMWFHVTSNNTWGTKVDSTSTTIVSISDSISGDHAGFYIPAITADTFNVNPCTATGIEFGTGNQYTTTSQLHGRISKYENIGGVIEATVYGSALNSLTSQPISFHGFISVKRIQ